MVWSILVISFFIVATLCNRILKRQLPMKDAQKQNNNDKAETTWHVKSQKQQ